VALGGGSVVLGQTLAIDRELLRLTGRRRPSVLLVPTASDDDADYERAFRLVYERRLGAEVGVLRLRRDLPASRALSGWLPTVDRAIRRADLVYVGGGNTLRMMRLWRRLGVDRMLKRACEVGTVLAGISAGAICWYESGHSDSLRFYHPDDWRYVRVRGLGLLPGIFCPHYDGEHRDRDFQAMIRRDGGVGLAADDGCALQFSGPTWRVIASRPGAAVHRVTRLREGGVATERLEPDRRFRPLHDLVGRG
jgi:dipeptidase E